MFTNLHSSLDGFLTYNAIALLLNTEANLHSSLDGFLTRINEIQSSHLDVFTF